MKCIVNEKHTRHENPLLQAEEVVGNCETADQLQKPSAYFKDHFNVDTEICM